MLKFFKKEKKFKKESSGFNPNLYWKLAVCFIFVVILSAFFFGYYLFVKIDRKPILQVGNSSGQVETIKKERIEKVLEYFSSQKQKSNQILNSSAPVIDPSL